MRTSEAEMRVEVLRERVNRLLDRKEVDFRVVHEEGGTPPREVVREELSKLLNQDKEKILVLNYKTSPGLRVSQGKALVFLDGFHVSQIEPKYRRLMGIG